MSRSMPLMRQKSWHSQMVPSEKRCTCMQSRFASAGDDVEACLESLLMPGNLPLRVVDAAPRTPSALRKISLLSQSAGRVKVRRVGSRGIPLFGERGGLGLSNGGIAGRELVRLVDVDRRAETCSSQLPGTSMSGHLLTSAWISIKSVGRSAKFST